MRKYLAVGLMLIAAFVAGVTSMMPRSPNASIVTITNSTGIHISFSQLSGDRKCGAYIVKGGKTGILNIKLKNGAIDVKVFENTEIVCEKRLNGSNTAEETLTFHRDGLCYLEIEASNASGEVDVIFE